MPVADRIRREAAVDSCRTEVCFTLISGHGSSPPALARHGVVPTKAAFRSMDGR